MDWNVCISFHGFLLGVMVAKKIKLGIIEFSGQYIMTTKDAFGVNILCHSSEVKNEWVSLTFLTGLLFSFR